MLNYMRLCWPPCQGTPCHFSRTSMSSNFHVHVLAHSALPRWILYWFTLRWHCALCLLFVHSLSNFLINFVFCFIFGLAPFFILEFRLFCFADDWFNLHLSVGFTIWCFSFLAFQLFFFLFLVIFKTLSCHLFVVLCVPLHLKCQLFLV